MRRAARVVTGSGGADLTRSARATMGACLAAVCLAVDASAQAPYDARIMAINDLWITITNYTQIGAPHNPIYPFAGVNKDPKQDREELRIRYLPSFEYPPLTRNDYLQSAFFLFGYVRGLDTVVVPAVSWIPEGPLIESTRRRGGRGYSPDATADLQFTCTFSDTSWLSSRFGFDYYTFTRYKPAGIQVRQTAYAWSVPFARRLVIFDYCIKNISTSPLSRATAGIVINSAPQNRVAWPFWSNEPRSLCGSVMTAPALVSGRRDSLNLIWVADADGDPIGNGWGMASVRAALGFRVLRHPPGGRLAFNWVSKQFNEWSPSGWVNHTWGPRRINSPLNDGGWRGLYRTMTNREIDYDQVYATFDFQATGWAPPPQDRTQNIRVARGGHLDLLLSAGPFDPIMPGDSASFTLAIIIGREFHVYPANHAYNLDAYSPQTYIERLDFTDLLLGARWADWIYDIPGYDTDGDGYRGEAHLAHCTGGNCDTVYYKGDGVPDFRTPQPPSSPPFNFSTQPYRVILRWSGAVPETEVDPMSGRRDFEGYRVYAGRSPVDDQMSLVASWDFENYNRFVYDHDRRRWRQVSFPRTAEDWRRIMGAPNLDLRAYNVPDTGAAYRDVVLDSVRNDRGDVIRIEERERLSYWAPEDDNRGNHFDDQGNIQRNAIQRIGERDTIIGDEVLTYGIYEATIENLNPSIPHYVGVTAFDHGNYIVGLASLESSPSANSVYAQPIYSPDVVKDSGLRVSVYPNPYRITYLDAHGNRTTYFAEGYEGDAIVQHTEQDRRVHFVNLPERATIRIYSLDGDLIREINHPDPFLTTYPSSVGWDLVSRNVQAVVSGIYIWRVDSDLGTQMGKLVIIK